MNNLSVIWSLLAGIAIFLLGMSMLEESLKQLAGRPFKLFLKKQSSSRPKAIIGGAVVTAILQSSSVVNLMVLAFVGANVIRMQQALAVMLGSNLGTTFSSWIIATVGFRLNIENIALPLAGLSGLTMFLSSKNSKLQHWSRLLFGTGLLFIGLNMIRNGMESSLTGINLSAFNTYPLIIFLLIGFTITAIIQSSTVTIAIVLSALHAGAIELIAAMAIVLGAEIGTIIKLVLASMNGLAAKKRVALGNLLFNGITTTIIFIGIYPVHRFITETIMIKDNLLALVFFQSFVNMAGIILFYPFLNIFTRFLENRFRNNSDESLFTGKVAASDTELALLALEKEVTHFLLHGISFTREAFGLPADERLTEKWHIGNDKSGLGQQYAYLKQLHGEALGYALKVQNNCTDDSFTVKLNQLASANRNTMYAVKSVKDALQDIDQLKNSSNDLKYAFYGNAREKAADFCNRAVSLIIQKKKGSGFPGLNDIHKRIIDGYAGTLQLLYGEQTHESVSEFEISTLINLNREMHTAYKSFMFALKDLVLDAKEAAYFDDLPGFIR